MGSYDALHAFRHSLYGCLHRRGDALFELTDAILSAHAAFPFPVHLSLEAPHRRGWGSLYAALRRGQIDAKLCRSCSPTIRSLPPEANRPITRWT